MTLITSGFLMGFGGVVGVICGLIAFGIVGAILGKIFN